MYEKKPENNSKYQLVSMRNIHPSTILPQRDHREIIAKSVKEVGIIQPLIVRPLSDSPGQYELIDGLGRLESLESDQLVPVQIVEATDSEAFRISNTTFKRQGRTTFDRACFFQAWLQTIINQKGNKDGAQAELAKNVGCSEGLISQYLAINQLFEKIKSLNPNQNFSMLKTMDLNRLYILSRIVENPHLSEVVLELEKKPDVTLDELKAKVEYLRTSQVSIDSLNLIPSDPTPDTASPHTVTLEKASKASQSKLTTVVTKATQNLTEVSYELSNLMLEIEKNTEKYASTEIIKTVNRVLKLLSELRSCTETLNKIAQPNTNSDQSSSDYEALLNLKL
jgi:ParB/RepB/Spo0J family partition protein